VSPFARTETKATSRSILPLKKSFRNSLILLLFLDLLAIFVLYQTQPKFTLAIGIAGDDTYLDNFYDREAGDTGNYRWTKDQASIVLPQVGSPFTIEMSAIVFRPNPVTAPTNFSLRWNNSSPSKAFVIPPDKAAFAVLNTYTLEGNATPQLDPQNGHLNIKADTFSPGKGDLRQLGILVKQVTMQAHTNSFGFVTPPLIPWFSVVLALLSVQSGLAIILSRLKLPRQVGIILFLSAALLLILAIAVVFLVAPTFYLTQTMVSGSYLLLPGLTIMATLLLKQRAFPWLGAGLALAIIANLYRVFDFSSLLVLCVSLLILCLIFNIRFEHTGLNILLIAIFTTLASWGILARYPPDWAYPMWLTVDLIEPLQCVTSPPLK
jgi:hypothetical protein